jgi:hypothetical protein
VIALHAVRVLAPSIRAAIVLVLAWVFADGDDTVNVIAAVPAPDVATATSTGLAASDDHTSEVHR